MTSCARPRPGESRVVGGHSFRFVPFSLGALAQPRANGLQSLRDEDFHGGIGREVSKYQMNSKRQTETP